MAFVPRQFEEILTDMIAHVRANTTLTDFTVGSVIRTILEAAALEDDEQYYQMVQLLSAFRIVTSSGTDLDERAADFNTERLDAKESSVTVVVRDGSLTTNELAFNVASGVLSIELSDSSDFPIAPPNYTIRIGEGTANVEDLTVNLNTTSSNTLSLTSATTQSHSIGERVSLVSGSDKSITRGLQVQVKATTTSLPIKFTTSEVGTLVAGNYESGLIDATAVEPGVDGNVPAGQISQFSATPPFTGALVTNITAATGGRDRETDDSLRDRLLQRLDELSRGTPNAIENGVIGVEDPDTGQRIVTAKLREDFINNDHVLYVDHGSGLVPQTTSMARTTLTAGATSGATTSLAVSEVDSFPTSGTLLLSPGVVGSAEVVEYSATGPGLAIVLDAAVANNHSIGAEVVLVDVIAEAAEEGQNYFQLSDYPVKINSFSIYSNRTGTLTQDVSGTDFFLNTTNGELQYAGSGLGVGTVVLGSYTYFTGLIQLAQKVLNGDPDDRVNYPGIVAGGVIIRLDVPTLRRISVTLAIQVSTGFDESEVAVEVRRTVESYIDNRKIGENIILAKIIEQTMGVDGVANTQVSIPTSDLVILEDELPVSFDSDGTSLVTVL